MESFNKTFKRFDTSVRIYRLSIKALANQRIAIVNPYLTYSQVEKLKRGISYNMAVIKSFEEKFGLYYKD